MNFKPLNNYVLFKQINEIKKGKVLKSGIQISAESTELLEEKKPKIGLVLACGSKCKEVTRKNMKIMLPSFLRNTDQFIWEGQSLCLIREEDIMGIL